MVHPLTGQTLKESDFIYLHRGGTGYAAANDQLEGKKHRPAMFCAQSNKIIAKTTTVDGRGKISKTFLLIFPSFLCLLSTKLMAKWSRVPSKL